MTAPGASTFVTTAQLTSGKTSSLAAPQSPLSTAAVVLSNQSPFLLIVNINGAQCPLLPYTQDRYLTSSTGAPITVTASNPENAPAGLPAYVVATWSDAALEDTRSYPSPVTASPYALGVAIGAQLLSNGVPNVLQETVLANAQLVAAGATVTFNVSGYASLSVIVAGSGPTQVLVSQTVNSDGTGPLVDTDTIFNPPTGGSFTVPVELAVRGAGVQFQNKSSGSVQLTVTGSNRPPGRRYDSRSNISAGDQWNFNGNLAAGVNTLSQVDNSVSLEGRCRLFFAASTGVKGRLQLKAISTATGATSLELMDTAQAIVSDLGGIVCDIDVALPPAPYTVQFQAAGAVAGIAIRATFLAADL